MIYLGVAQIVLGGAWLVRARTRGPRLESLLFGYAFVVFGLTTLAVNVFGPK